MTYLKTFFVFLFLTLNISCLEKKSKLKTTHWDFKTMDKALEKASSEKKLLFVYWGAIWCPPCNALKSTTFKDEQFIKTAQKFVTVYLDGDTEQAQKWGEKLNVKGYPTLMVLTPQLNEIVRLSSSSNPKLSSETLELALQQNSNTLDLLNEYSKKESFTLDELKNLQILRSYSWWQDSQVLKDKLKYSNQLFKVESIIQKSETVLKSNLYLTALNLKLATLKEKEKFSNNEVKTFHSYVLSALNDKTIFLENLESFFYNSMSYVTHLTQTETEKKNLSQFIIDKMSAYRESKVFINLEQILDSYNPLLEVLDSDKTLYVLTDEQRLKLKSETFSLLNSTKDPKKRVSLINTLGYLLFTIGYKDEAEKVLKEELKTAINPYYVMSTLGYFEKSKGNKDKSLEWYKKAYETSEGTATKLQWHAKYLRTLVSLTPKNYSVIMSEMNHLISKSILMSDAFMGRNFRVLEGIKKSLIKWGEAEKQGPIINKLQNSGLNICKKSNWGEFYKESCKSYFNSLTL